eukprot:3963796-Pyramimonas_sp.AAC.1
MVLRSDGRSVPGGPRDLRSAIGGQGSLRGARGGGGSCAMMGSAPTHGHPRQRSRSTQPAPF